MKSEVFTFYHFSQWYSRVCNFRSAIVHGLKKYMRVKTKKAIRQQYNLESVGLLSSRNIHISIWLITMADSLTAIHFVGQDVDSFTLMSHHWLKDIGVESFGGGLSWNNIASN